MQPFLPFAMLADATVPPWLIIPFGVLILMIAVMPLTPERVKHLWERGYPFVSLGLGALVAVWYLAFQTHGGEAVVGVIREYGAFIALIGSLYVVAGGIHVGVNGKATPAENVRFLLLGALAANLVGTTGASMVLIRPWLRMNSGRVAPHHVVFFIFIVSNCGGALTPIGDPPLFLGYLRGVPFFWLMANVLAPWLFVIGALLAVFWWIDRRAFRKQVPSARIEATEPDALRVTGKINLLFLVVIVGAVFIPPTIPGLREGVMLAAAFASHRLTAQSVHDANAFSFGPIREVAVLFAGIFFTMMPALEYIAEHGREFGVEKPLQYYAASGSLSAVLDNAPTYATFFELSLVSARQLSPDRFPAEGAAMVESTAALLLTAPDLVIAVSLGAVFFGAMTYIGNGPNFMVKAIADASGVTCPGFFGYIVKFSLPILLPILLLAGWIFL